MPTTPSVTPNMTTTPAPLPTLNGGSFLNGLQTYLVQSPLLNTVNGETSDITQQINDINATLGEINSSITATSVSNILSQQDGIQTIVDTEMTRLNDKKESIDRAIMTQKRMMVMNDSYTKRQQAYTKIVIAISIGLFLLILVRIMSYQYQSYDSLGNFLTILIIVITLIWCAWAFVAIWRRDPVYFDQLNFIPNDYLPRGSNENVAGSIIQSTVAGQGSGELISGTNANIHSTCVGAACCSNSTHTTWDPSNNVCVKESFIGNTLPAQVPPTTIPNNVKRDDTIPSFLPSEYDQYRALTQMTTVPLSAQDWYSIQWKQIM